MFSSSFILVLSKLCSKASTVASSFSLSSLSFWSCLTSILSFSLLFCFPSLSYSIKLCSLFSSSPVLKKRTSRILGCSGTTFLAVPQFDFQKNVGDLYMAFLVSET